MIIAEGERAQESFAVGCGRLMLSRIMGRREREKSFGWWYAFFVLERVSSFVSTAEKNWGVVGGMNGAVFSLR